MIDTIWWAFIALACFTAGIGILREAFTLFYDTDRTRPLYSYWMDDRWIIRRENGTYERESNQ